MKRRTDHQQTAGVVGRRAAIASLGFVCILVVAGLLVSSPVIADPAIPSRLTVDDAPGNETALVAPGALARHPYPAGLLREATHGERVARGDVAVARFEVPGLDDYYDDALPRSELGTDQLSVTVGPADSNRAGVTPGWRSDAANVTIIPEPGEGTLYVLWRVPLDADTGDYVVALMERDDSASGNRSADVSFTVVEREVRFAYGEMAIFQPATTFVVGNTTVAPGTHLALQARSPGEPDFPVNATIEVPEDRSFTARMEFGETTNGTAFALSALGYPDSSVPGRIIGPAPPTSTTTTHPTESTTTGVTTPRPVATTSEVTTTGGQSGFGPVVAVVSVLLALAGVAGRRWT